MKRCGIRGLLSSLAWYCAAAGLVAGASGCIPSYPVNPGEMDRYWSLHPDSLINTRGTNELDSRHTQVLMASLAGFTGLYVWLYTIGCRVEKIRQRLQQEDL